MDKTVLMTRNGRRRATHLPIHRMDWLYIDDWAKEHVIELYSGENGEKMCLKLEGTRMLTCDPRGAGDDIVEFIRQNVRPELRR